MCLSGCATTRYGNPTAATTSPDFNKGLACFNRGDSGCAINEWTPLADQGSVGAQYNLGRLYREGLGVPKDYVKAAKYMQLAADQDNALALNDLSIHYYYGLGVKKDYSKSNKYLMLSASLGHPPAQHTLGVRYGKGETIQQDLQQSQIWLKRACNKNFKPSCELLSNLNN